MKLDFLRIFDLFSKHFVSRVSWMLDYFSSYLPKLKGGLELVTGAYSLHVFPKKIFLI